jgi:hypothetical protein
MTARPAPLRHWRSYGDHPLVLSGGALQVGALFLLP